jgi:hypothetical protein
MTSINSTDAVGRQTIDGRSSAAVSSGTVSSIDQTAFAKTLESIDTGLASSSTSGSAAPADSALQGVVAQAPQGAPATHRGHGHDGGHGGGESGLAALVGTGDTSSSTATDGSTDTDSDSQSGLDAFGMMSAMAGMGDVQAMPGSTSSADEDGAVGPPSSASACASTGSAASSSTTGTDPQQELETLVNFLENVRASLTGSDYGAASTNMATTAGVTAAA